METTAPVTPEKKARNPLAALVLNLLAPGLGYLYLGRPVVAFFVAAVYQLIPPLVTLWWSYARFDPRPIIALNFVAGSVPMGLSALQLLPIATGIHALILARKAGVMTLKSWQRPLGYGTFFLVTSMCGYQLGHWVEGNFARPVMGFPSNALAPDVKQGELVILLKTKEARLPQRNGLAVFAPGEEFRQPVLARVVAMAPDKVSVQDGGVYVNGEWKFDAQDGGTLAETQLGEGQYFGIASGRNPAEGILDSRDLGPLKAGDYLGTIGVIVFERPDPNARPVYAGKWLLPR